MASQREPSYNPDLADLVDRRMQGHDGAKTREEARRALLAARIQPPQTCPPECSGRTTTDLDGEKTCMKCGRPPS